jgi:CRISPR/Cas system CMR subunit Cmr6 (Cas7 group RAMP superfamily)
MIVFSCFSQESYPKKVYLNNDTIVALTLDQFRLANQKLVENRYMQELTDSLNSYVLRLKKQVEVVTERTIVYKEISSNKTAQIEFLKAKDEKSQESIKYINEQIKYLKGKRTKDAIIFSGIGLSVGVIIISLLQ